MLINVILLCVGTEVEGTFRVSGSSKRMSELQAIFEAPPKVCLLALKASDLPASSSVLAPPLPQLITSSVWQELRVEIPLLHPS
jgi:hypothetical protein